MCYECCKLSRSDFRHNFSPHFYLLYLADLSTNTFGDVYATPFKLLSSIAFIPQVRPDFYVTPIACITKCVCLRPLNLIFDAVTSGCFALVYNSVISPARLVLLLAYTLVFICYVQQSMCFSLPKPLCLATCPYHTCLITGNVGLHGPVFYLVCLLPSSCDKTWLGIRS